MKRKILFFIAEDWYFASHRLSLARAAKEAGFDVTVVTRVRKHGDAIRAAGLTLVPIDLDRRSLNPIKEVRVLWKLASIYRAERPDLVHHVAMKPIVYGTMAAILTGTPRTVNALAGLGWTFTANTIKARALGAVVRLVLRCVLRRGPVIVQNPDDLEWVAKLGIRRSKIHLVLGAGVNTQEFAPADEPSPTPSVVLASRMLHGKGVADFVEAARRIRAEGIDARFILVGAPDPGNPASIKESQLLAWETEGAVEWWGHRDDMPSVLARSAIVCLPSFYGEGIPKILIEAAASGRAIVTTDTPGCREIVKHEANGLLVRPRDIGALTLALKRLLRAPEMRRRMGEKGREMSVAKFSMGSISDQTIMIFRECLG